jgi:hypothetical protein
MQHSFLFPANSARLLWKNFTNKRENLSVAVLATRVGPLNPIQTGQIGRIQATYL